MQLSDQPLHSSRQLLKHPTSKMQPLRGQLPALNSAAHQLIPIYRRIASDALAPNRQLLREQLPALNSAAH